MNLLLFNLKLDADDDVLGFTTEWVNALARRCDRVFVITMSAGRIAVADNVTVYSVGRELGYSEPRRVVRFYRLLNRVLRDNCIDACFTHMIQIFAVMAWPLLRMRGIPLLLWYAHGHIPLSVRVAERMVDVVLASTSSGFPLPTAKLRIIGQGIDTDRFVPTAVDRSRFELLCVGRVSRIKRLDLAIRALSRLAERAPDGREIRLRFVGRPLTPDDVDHQRELVALAEREGVSQRVAFASSKSFAQVHETYAAAEIFVNSSETHSADKAVLEAMSCGIPVVTSNAAFLQLLPPELRAVCTLPPGDADSLVRTLNAMIAMPAAERARIGARGRDVVVADHSLEALAGKILNEAGAQIASRRTRKQR